MPLLTVDAFDGGSAIRPELPAIETHRDVVYLPFDAQSFFDADPGWGIYRNDGALIPAAAYRRFDPPELVGQSWQAERAFEDIPYAPDVKYLYAGPLIPHYGHFLLSSLARLWPLVTQPGIKPRVLFHAYGTPEEWFGDGNFRDLLGALGLGPHDCAVFDHPVRLPALIIPEPSFGELSYAHRVHAELCHVIGTAILPPAERVDDRRPVYLAKTRLANGVGRMSNEDAMLLELVRMVDIEVVFPEQLSLARQIALFTAGRLVVGATSSAFHTSIFSDNRPELLQVSYRPSVPSNYKMIDEINDNRTSYVWPEDDFLRHDRDDQFLETFESPDPVSLARELAELIKLKVGGNIMPAAVSQSPAIVNDHQGENYQRVLAFLHEALAPRTYLEIGTLSGETLALARCPSIAIDPEFHLAGGDAIGSKPICALFQMTSDAFFADHDPTRIFGRPIDFAFLDGMHRCEYLLRDFIGVERHCKANSVIAMHDCLPLEHPMAERDFGHDALQPHRQNWWTGDVWRAVLMLKRYRPDLSISAFDAAPTGLVLITNLDPNQRELEKNYARILPEMFALSLEEIGIEAYFNSVNVEPVASIMSHEKLTRRFWL